MAVQRSGHWALSEPAHHRLAITGERRMLSVEETLEHLALAYGGASQYPIHAVGWALAGQVNNLVFARVSLRRRVGRASRLFDEYWEVTEDSFLWEIERGVVLAAIEFDNVDLLQDWE